MKQLLAIINEYVLLERVIGFLILATSIVAAIFFRYPYYYSFFVIGMFLFFDSFYRYLQKDKNLYASFSIPIFLSLNLRKIFYVLLFVFITDFLLGQVVLKLWTYPYYDSFFNIILLYVIIYPIGGISVLAMYRVFYIIFSKEFKNMRIFHLGNPKKLVYLVIHISMYLLPTAVILPLVLFTTDSIVNLVNNKGAYLILSLFILYEWTFLFDIITLAYKGRPLMLDLLEGNMVVIISIFVTALLGAFLHEYINTFAYEWRYNALAMPFSVEILGIPVFIFVCWIFLTAMCISASRSFYIVAKHHIKNALQKEYLGV